jgi:uncharacterized membrane protein
MINFNLANVVVSDTKSGGRQPVCRNLPMANPFDWRAILLAKHAQHVVLIHFPIALFISGPGLDLLSRGKRDSQLAVAAHLNLFLAAVSVLPTVVTGVLAWKVALEGARLAGLLLLHFVAALLAGLLIVASWWMHWRARKSQTLLLPRYRIPIELLGVAVIALTAHLRGFLTGVNTQTIWR